MHEDSVLMNIRRHVQVLITREFGGRVGGEDHTAIAEVNVESESRPE